MTPKVVVVPHDPRWADAFMRESEAIRRILGDAVLAVEHVGSTAVPGLAAKPIIDLIVGIADYGVFDQCRQSFEALGYDYTPDAERDDPSRKVFRKGPAGEGEMRTHHLHLTEWDGPYWRRLIGFRDRLRANHDTARRYEALKAELATLFPTDGRSYTQNKSNFVRSVESALGLMHTGPMSKPGETT